MAVTLILSCRGIGSLKNSKPSLPVLAPYTHNSERFGAGGTAAREDVVEKESQSEASLSPLQSSPLEYMSLIKAGRRVGVRYLGK